MRRGQMSLTEVLSDAGGVNPFSAAGNQIYILRANPNVASPTQAARDLVVYLFEGRDPSNLVLADQFPVLPRDVVFINPTGPTMIGRFIGQFLPVYSTATTLIENPY
jgi:polysaccharide export outer membrane protein